MEKAFRHDDFLTWYRIHLQGLSDNLLGSAIGIDIGRVPGVDAIVERGFQDWKGFGFVVTPGKPAGVTEGHSAEDGVGDAEARGAELDVFYGGGGGSHCGLRCFFWVVVEVGPMDGLANG